MNLFFVHDVPVRILQDPLLVDLGYNYDTILHYRPGLFATLRLSGHVLIHIEDNLLELLDEITRIITDRSVRIAIFPSKQLDVSSIMQQHFKVVRAAGGIVRKKDYWLMIYRARRWDLPKGGIELGETAEQAAVREVHEECGVMAHPQVLFYTTWHAFRLHDIPILKETTWYIMDCIDDIGLAPQKEEGIKQVVWMAPADFQNVLKRTYKSVQFLLHAYHNRLGTFAYKGSGGY